MKQALWREHVVFPPPFLDENLYFYKETIPSSINSKLKMSVEFI